MRIRRRADEAPATEADTAAEEAPGNGPWDISDRPGLEGYLDFGSLLVPVVDADLRVNIDEASGQIMSLAWLKEDAGLEVSVFAAPRTPGIWDELRPQLAADATQRGGAVDQSTGPYGAEVICSLPVQLPDGTGALQATRIFAFEGERWLLRGAMMGRPVAEPEAAEPWYALFGALVVRRGSSAMPVGEALELRLPPDAQPGPGPKVGGDLDG